MNVSIHLSFELPAARLPGLMDAIAPFVTEANYTGFSVHKGQPTPANLPAPATLGNEQAPPAEPKKRTKKAEEAPAVPTMSQAEAEAAMPKNPATAAHTKPVSLEDLKAAAMDFVKAKGEAPLIAAIKTFKAAKLSEVSEADRPRLLALLKGL